MKRFLWLLVIAFPLLLILTRQDSSAQDIKSTIVESGRVAIAIPDFRGSGAAQNFMGAFNDTLWGDISGSGVVRMVPKTMYPTTVPQQPSDFREPPPPTPEPTRGRKRNQSELVTPPTGGGLWLSDWSGP